MTSNIVKRALINFNNSKVSISGMAKYVGFSSKELTMLSRFWKPAFDGGWILLSDELVLGKLTRQLSPSAMSNFHKKLKRDYTEHIDYEQITKGHELVQQWISDTNKDYNKLGSKHYYAVTGETYKDLLVRANTVEGGMCRAYYRKVERLAIIMREYTRELSELMFDSERKSLQDTIERQSEELVAKNSRNQLLKSFSNHLQERLENGYFYIASTKQYAGENYFKLGVTTNLRSRLRTYNCERPEHDMMYYCFTHKCHNAYEVEKRTKSLLVDFQQKNMKKGKKDETYFCNFQKLYAIVTLVCDNYNREISELNSMIKTFDKDFSKTSEIPQEVDFEGNYEITVTRRNSGRLIEARSIEVSDLTSEQKKEKLAEAINLCMNAEISKGDVPFDFNVDNTHQNKTVLQWPQILKNLMKICRIRTKPKIKASLWKPTLKEMVADSGFIESVRWVKK